MRDFENSQFLSISVTSSVSLLQQALEEIFRDTNFNLQKKEEINHVKLMYFSDFLLDYFYELRDEDFMGEFDDWQDVKNPPAAIRQFVTCVSNILKIEGVNYVYVILTNYACEDITTNGILECKIEKAYKKLFSASIYWIQEKGLCYEDNLIIKVMH